MEISKNEIPVRIKDLCADQKEAQAIGSVLEASSEPSLSGELDVLLKKLH